jgi:hypothetical protein
MFYIYRRKKTNMDKANAVHKNPQNQVDDVHISYNLLYFDNCQVFCNNYMSVKVHEKRGKLP